MTTLRLIIAPDQEPLYLDELKVHLRVLELDESDSGAADAVIEEALLNGLIKAARQTVEQYCGPLVTQTWEQYEPAWPEGDALALRKARVQSVAGLVYTDTDGTPATLSTAYYSTDVIDEFRPRLVLNCNYAWPAVTLHPVNPIKITFTAGYGDAPEDVPEPIRQALLLLCAHWYENREPYNISVSGNSVVPVPWTVDALIAPYRVWGFDL